MLSIVFSFHSAFFHISVARGPQLRSAPLALPSVRDATHCVIFFFTVNIQLRFNPHLISASPDLRISAPPPSPQPSSRGIVGRRLRQLRCCVADFPHSASLLLQFCGVVRVSLSIVGWPSVRLTPFLRAGRSVRGFGSRRGQPRSPFFHISASRILHVYSCFHIPVARGLPGFACAHPCRTLPTASYFVSTRAAAASG